ncbi:MAG: transposase [Edaphobacter sp.]
MWLERSRWVRSRRNFFLPVRVLSRMFRGKLLAFLKQSYRHNQLRFSGAPATLFPPHAFHSLLHTLRNKEWVVYSKPPFGGPEHVLKYLARYTHRVAISNGRLLLTKPAGRAWTRKRRINSTASRVMTLLRLHLNATAPDVSTLLTEPRKSALNRSCPQCKNGTLHVVAR